MLAERQQTDASRPVNINRAKDTGAGVLSTRHVLGMGAIAALLQVKA
jgi:hypothetical protein